MSTRIASQYGGEQRPIAAAHVYHGPRGREIVGGDNRLRRRGCVFGIRRIRQERGGRMFPEPIEGVFPVEVVESRLSGRHTVNQRSPGTPHPFLARYLRVRPPRARHSRTAYT